MTDPNLKESWQPKMNQVTACAYFFVFEEDPDSDELNLIKKDV